MYPKRFVGLPLLLVVLWPAWSRGADPAPVSALKAKGLTKSGVTFVIEAEKPVLAKMKEFRAVLAEYSAVVERQAEDEQVAADLAQLEQRRAELLENLNDLNQRINEQGYQQPNNPAQRGFLSQLIMQRNLVKNTLAEVTSGQKPLRDQAPAAKEKAALNEEARKAAKACKAAVEELRPMVDGVAKQYADLASDASVKSAVNGLEKATKANLRISPSDSFKAGVRTLEQAERRLLGKKAVAVSRKKTRSRK